MAVYILHTEAFGELRKSAASIAAAREWARSAFPAERVLVQREYRRCEACDSSPCSCSTIRRNCR